jgi:hypothetical protein
VAARYEQTRKLTQELDALNQPADAPPGVESLWTRARKLMELHDDAAALPVVEQVLALDPTHAAANFVCGRHHLGRDDPRGVAFIEAAITSDPSLTEHGCNLLYGHFTRTGQRERLRPLEERVDRFHELAARAQRERAEVSAEDTFIAHGLAPGAVATLHGVFATEPDIAAAAIVRKQVMHFTQDPAFIVGLRLKYAWWKLRSSGDNPKLVRRLLQRLGLPGHTMVFVVEKNRKALGKKVFAAPGATVYVRPAKS